MKILFIHQDTCLYGASRSLLALIGELKKSGHSCFVLLPGEGKLIGELERQEIEHAIVPWRGWTCTEGTPWARRLAGGVRDWLYNKKKLSEALSYLESFNPYLIHTNSSKTAFGAMLAERAQIPHIWHFREFLGGPFSVGLVFRFGQWLSQRFIAKRSGAAIVISEAVRNQLSYVSKSIKTQTISNGVMTREDMERSVTPVPPLTNGTIKLAYVGRFSDWKQPFVALEAIRILVNQGYKAELYMAGGGSESEVKSVSDFVVDNGLRESVHLLGVVSNVSDVYQKSHALVMPSRGDAFGRVTAEAMANGRPVIGARAGATPELVAHGSEGFLFEPGNSAELANCIERLIRIPEEMQRMGERAWNKARSQFTTQEYAGAVFDVYEAVLEHSVRENDCR